MTNDLMNNFTFLTGAAVLLATVCVCTPKLAPETPEQKAIADAGMQGICIK